MWTAKIYFLLCLSTVALAQVSETNPCSGKKPCGACIQAHADCGWCKQTGYDIEHKDRCDVLSNLIQNGCDAFHIVAPEPNRTYIKNLNVQNAEDGNDAIQLQPQEMHLKLRPKTPYTFNVLFRQAENFPVDLYFVMDLSSSMADDKNKLSELGDLLSIEMAKITKNFRLGFGSFVDKKTMPYVNTLPEKLISPCTGCAPPYGFKNQLNLTDDTSQFKTKVVQAPTSGNQDGPEGGFDAIMQAVTCGKKIGWRESAKKVLLFSTDADFHYAGDGKLGGIVEPNDGHCHMANDVYTKSLEQDYPSIGQLAQKIAENKVSIIFAVTKQQQSIYKKLSKLIEASSVGELADDSRNIVKLVRQNYEKIISLLELKTQKAEDVQVIFKSKCFGDTLEPTSKCQGLGIGQNVSFEVTIEVEKCSPDRNKWKKSFDIYPAGRSEKLTVNLELDCECPCEGTKYEEPLSPKCNNTGTFECGACTCPEGLYGATCECDGSSLNTNDYDASCRMSNDTEAICENNGECICGTCECSPISPKTPNNVYSGKYCQCNDYSCDYHNGLLCGGPTHGDCTCGECICKPGYNGTACGCAISKDECIASNGKECNDKGTCKCGICTCDKDTYYAGPTCEDCPTCKGHCELVKACVQCRMYGTGPYSKDYCMANCTEVEKVPSVAESAEKKLCQFRDDDDCMFYFTYEYISKKLEAQEEKECPKPVYVWGIVGGVIGSIVAIGIILLLIYKLIITINDRREYARFLKDRQNAKWDTGENPIFKGATSTYQNPMYGGK